MVVKLLRDLLIGVVIGVGGTQLVIHVFSL